METEHCGLLIVGAGHAGSELAVAARQAGWADDIVLAGDEPALPYHRPPLSKTYLQGKATAESIALRSQAAYDNAHVRRLTDAHVVAIDRGQHRVTLADGRQLGYRKLAWCAGGRPRPLAAPGIDPAAPPANLLYLRTLADADRIRAELVPGARLVIVGAGYVGLETAASARALGAEVTVLEVQPRVLARVVGPALSEFYASVHRSAGVTVHTGVSIEGVDCDGGRIRAVRCAGGVTLPADLVIAGIGMLPNVAPLQAAGLAGPDGVPVDELSRTADPDIVAAGDCTLHTLDGRSLRIESVANALEQARTAAATLAGKARAPQAVPWFWSDQYDLKLQMAGLSHGHDRCVIRGDLAARSFCAFYLQGSRLLAVDAVNRPGDFMLMRRVLGQRPVLDVARLADEAHPLKDLVRTGDAAPTPRS